MKPNLNARKIFYLSLLLAAVTVAVYWPVRHHDFIGYDDGDYISSNPHVAGGVTSEGLAWAFRTGYASNWHPVTWLSHMLDVQLFGLNAGAHHLVNVCFHAANAVLLFLFLVRSAGGGWRSFFVAALFALHPLRVESVAWAAERKDVLSVFFFMLTLLAYVRYASRVEPKVQSPKSKVQSPRSIVSGHFRQFRGSHVIWYLAALGLFAFGLMSKPMVVTLPFVLLLLDIWPLGRVQSPTSVQYPVSSVQHPKCTSRTDSLTRQPPRPHAATLLRLVLEKLPFLLLSALSCAATLRVQRRAMLSSTELSLGVRLANALVSYIRYIGKVLWPKDLAVIYPHPQHWPLWQVLGAAFLILLLSVLVLQAAKRCPWLLVGWFWFVGTLVPVIGLVQVGAQSIADRYTYLPSIGIFILVTWPLAEWAEGRGSRVERQDARTLARSYALTLLAIVALLTCAIATRAQIGVWQDTETLFTHALAATGEQNWVAHQNLALLAMERYHKSERSSIEHQRLDEVAGKAGTSGAPLSQTQDYLEAAIRHSAAAIKAKPRYPDAHVTLAKALMEQGKLDEAEEHLKTALALDRRQPEGSQNFAELLMRRGRLNEAIGQYRAALELKPDWDAGLNNLAWVLATASRSELRDGPEALRLAQRACSLTGRTNLWFLHTLAAAYANGGQFSEAIFTANEALRLATLTDNTNLIETAAARVALYQAGQPLRD